MMAPQVASPNIMSPQALWSAKRSCGQSSTMSGPQGMWGYEEVKMACFAARGKGCVWVGWGGVGWLGSYHKSTVSVPFGPSGYTLVWVFSGGDALRYPCPHLWAVAVCPLVD